MAQEANRPANTPKLPEEARELVLRLKDLVTATRQRIAESREIAGRLSSIEHHFDHHDAPHGGGEGAEGGVPAPNAGSPDGDARG